jgi:hypothetical protein
MSIKISEIKKFIKPEIKKFKGGLTTKETIVQLNEIFSPSSKFCLNEFKEPIIYLI